MNKLEPAAVDWLEERELARQILAKWRVGDPLVRQAIPTVKESEAIKAIDRYIEDEIHGSKIWKNDVYQVAVRKRGANLVHLSIKRIDRGTIHDWRDLQEIKNQLVGPECEGVELYPAESRLVDTANQYHIWCSTDPKFRFPFGFDGRFVQEETFGKAVNRPFA